MKPRTDTPTLLGGPYCGSETRPEDSGPRIVIKDALRSAFHVYQRSPETGRHYYFVESQPFPKDEDAE